MLTWITSYSHSDGEYVSSRYFPGFIAWLADYCRKHNDTVDLYHPITNELIATCNNRGLTLKLSKGQKWRKQR